MGDNETLSYADAGVNMEEGERLVADISKIAATTSKMGVMSGVGSFGGVFDLKATGFKDPVLVAATDGVGTKLQLAEKAGGLDKIGIDLVAMCANDVLAMGARPLFFLDYLACSKLDPKQAAEIVGGIADGCRQAQMALLGGESAEMPGLYPKGSYDLAGFCVGAAERGRILDGKDIAPGDVIMALASSGVHSNGYSLVRKILHKCGIEQTVPESWPEQASNLLAPTRIYVQSVLPLIQDNLVRGIAHITGGGLEGNLPRALPDGTKAGLIKDSWQWPQPFPWLQERGNVTNEEMLRTFNCGVGMALVVAAKNQSKVEERLRQAGEDVWLLGHVEQSDAKMPSCSWTTC